MTEVSTGLHGARSSVGYSHSPQGSAWFKWLSCSEKRRANFEKKSLFQGLTSPEYEIGFWPKSSIPFETFQLA